MVAQPIFLTGRVQEEIGTDAQTQTIPAATGQPTGVVVFFVQPNVSESGTANYLEVGDMRQAASLLIYTGSPSRTFSIDATFVSRTVSEAETNLAYVNTLRSWRMPEKTGDGEFNTKTPSRLFLNGLKIDGLFDYKVIVWDIFERNRFTERPGALMFFHEFENILAFEKKGHFFCLDELFMVLPCPSALFDSRDIHRIYSEILLFTLSICPTIWLFHHLLKSTAIKPMTVNRQLLDLGDHKFLLLLDDLTYS